MSSIIKNYQISFLKKDNYACQLSDKSAFCKPIRSSSTLLLGYTKKIINKKCNLKLKNRINRLLRSIGKHIATTLFMENFMIRAKNNNFNKREQNNSRNMQTILITNCRHLIFTDNHLQQITPNLFHNPCKYLISVTPMLKNAIKPNMLSQINIKKEIYNMKARMRVF